MEPKFWIGFSYGFAVAIICVLLIQMSTDGFSAVGIQIISVIVITLAFAKAMTIGEKYKKKPVQPSAKKVSPENVIH
jgi:hypothetical protein